MTKDEALKMAEGALDFTKTQWIAWPPICEGLCHEVHLGEIVLKVEAALAAIRTAQDWRDMDTAPKDGTKILAINNRGNQCVCLFMEGRWHSMFSSSPSSFINGGCGSVLTHWMPLPAPPATPGGGR